MKHSTIINLFFALFIVATVVARAEDYGAPTKGLRADLLANIAGVEQKIEDLAAAMPADTYSWRPMEGVRSVSEVYMHITGANYLFPGFAGVKKPDDLPKDMEKTVTDKEKVLGMLKQSFEHLRNAIINTTDEDLEKGTKMFGNETTYRNVFITAVTHLHEHLGQSIAYARSNKIVPPWTAAENAAAAKKDGK